MAALGLVALGLAAALPASVTDELGRSSGKSAVHALASITPEVATVEHTPAPQRWAPRGQGQPCSWSAPSSHTSLVERSEARASSDARTERVAFFRPRKHVPRMGSDEPPRA